MTSSFRVSAIAAAFATIALASGPTVFAEQPHGGRVHLIPVGAESPDMATQVNAYLSGPIDVNVGDTINWRVDSTEFHTVSFLSGAAPERFEVPTPDGNGMMVSPMAAFPIGGATYDGSGIASSGVLNKDQGFSLTFAKAGEYEYVCLVHPDMKGEVRVHDGTHAAASVTAGDGANDVSLMRFVPGDLEIHVGETVSFANHDLSQMPHTVSFRSGQASPEAIVPQPQPSGPPLLVFNPNVVEPRGNASAFAGDEYVNSGVLVEGAGQSFTVTFTKSGTYEYVCLFHENMGMKGTITVLP